MTDQPKPCPFCGSENVRHKSDDGGTFFYCKCLDCGVRTAAKSEVADAFSAWNLRALPWVPVAERLPEPEQLCLWVAGKVLWIGFVEKHDWHPNFYTHWLPISEDFFPAVDKLAQGGAG